MHRNLNSKKILDQLKKLGLEYKCENGGKYVKSKKETYKIITKVNCFIIITNTKRKIEIHSFKKFIDALTTTEDSYNIKLFS